LPNIIKNGNNKKTTERVFIVLRFFNLYGQHVTCVSIYISFVIQGSVCKCYDTSMACATIDLTLFRGVASNNLIIVLLVMGQKGILVLVITIIFTQL
jgi:hypothetical protein